MTTPAEERQVWNHKASNAAYRVWNDRDKHKWREAANGCADYFHQELGPVWGGHSVFLDIGCGIGRLIHRLSRRDRSPFIHGIDISERMLDIARQNKRENEKFSLCDGRKLDFPDAAIDGVYSMITFQHMPQKAFKGYIREISRVLRSRGMFCFQYVEGDSQKPFAYESKLEDVVRWCTECGLTVNKINRSFVFDSWTWLTGGKHG